MKQTLFTPGPTPVPTFIQEEIQKPLMYHRLPEFVDIFNDMIDRLQWLFHTKHRIVALTASGSAGLEAAIVNLFSPGDEVCVAEMGKFSERFVRISQTYRLKVHTIECEWGTSVRLDQIKGVFAQHPEIKAVMMPHCETSTGAVNDLETIGTWIRDHTSGVFIVDAISSMGALPLFMDTWGIDVVVTSSNKGMLNPPGLALVGISDRAWKLQERARLSSFYLNFQKAWSAYEKGQATPFTPAIPLVRGVRRALMFMQEQGLENLWRRHDHLATACRAAMEAFGFPIFPKYPSSSVTVASMPGSLPASEVVNLLKTNTGFVIANGQAKLKNKVIRIGHFGDSTIDDLAQVVAALEKVFRHMNWSVADGIGETTLRQKYISLVE